MASRVLILCTGNSCRSQMAEGVLRHYGKGKYEVFSAGTHPSSVHPIAIRLMEEIGIDISRHRSKSVEEFLGQKFDIVITVCDNAQAGCPAFPGGGRQIHWPFPDPAVNSDEFRRVRDMIHERFREAAEAGDFSAPAEPDGIIDSR